MMAMVWLKVLGLPLPIAAIYGLDNSLGKDKIELYTCACQAVVSNPNRTRRKVQLWQP